MDPLQQEPSIEWQKCVGGKLIDFATCIVHTSDGGYAVAGYSNSTDGASSGNHGDYDYLVIKFSSSGNIEWEKSLGGGADDRAYSLVQTSDGGFVVAGNTASPNGDVTGNKGWVDVWIAKLTAAGNIQWQKCYGGAGVDYAYSIIQTSDGGYAFAGSTASTDGDVSGHHTNPGNSTMNDAWVVKLDSFGAIEWEKCLGGTGTDDIAKSIIQTSDHGYAIAGSTDSNDGDVSGNHGGYDGWVVKLTSAGNIEWQKCLGGSFGEVANSIIQTSDAGFAVAGYTGSSDGDFKDTHGDGDGWIVKLNSSGSTEWEKCLGGTGSEEIFSLLQTSDQGYVLAGYTTSNDGDVSGKHANGGSYFNDKMDMWIIKVTSAGNRQWQECLGGTHSDQANSIIESSDGGFAVTGITESSDGDASGLNGIQDYWIVKLKK